VVTKAVEKSLPPLFKRHVRRPRLTRIIEESPAQVVLVIGPAGYGKTTLVAEWLQEHEAGAWYRTTPDLADLAGFAVGLVEVIQRVVPNAGDRLLRRLGVAELPARRARTMAEVLAEELRDWPPDRRIVVDDYHLAAESEAVEDFVDWLLTMSPLRLVITTRRRPRWASARRVLYGEITELGREQLALSHDEAGAVLSVLPDREARRLIEEARGWPALIGLASITESTELPPNVVADALYRYFAEEVLRLANGNDQLAMLKVSVAPRLVPEYLFALDDPSGAIATLLAERGEVLPIERQTNRIHPLLRSFLLHRFEERDPEQFIAVHRNLAQVARRNNAWSEAVELAVGGRAADLAEEIVNEAGSIFLAEGRFETVLQWLAAIEGLGPLNPEMELLRAEALLKSGELEESHALACHVTTYATDPSIQSRAWRVRGQASYWQTNPTRALEEVTTALANATDSQEKQDALWAAFIAAQDAGLDSAIDYVDQLEAIDEVDARARLRIAVGRATFAARKGSFSGGLDLLASNAAFLREVHDPEVKSSFLAYRAYLEVNAANYARAYKIGQEASNYARELKLRLPLHTCLACQALASAGLRRFGDARRLLREASLMVVDDDPTLRVMTSILKLRLQLSQGKPLSESEYHQTPTTNNALAGELLALQGLAAAAHGDIGATTDLQRQADTLSGSVEKTVYSSFALRIADVQLLDRNRARQRLRETLMDALARACPDSFILAYRAYPPLLMLAAEDPKARVEATRLVSLARDQRLAARFNIHAPTLDPVRSVLTSREVEVLNLMSDGLSNHQIAASLVISPNTAKVHVHNILRKLGATTRLQAIARYPDEEPEEALD
jgi:LuxR family transcriptional regulator, maltose regulon positive regulatory protein